MPQEQPSSYPELSFEDNKISQPGTERAPLLVNCAFACFASDPHTQSWELLAAKTTHSERCLSSRAKETPVGYSLLLFCVVRRAQSVRNHPEGQALSHMIQIYCSSPSPRDLEISECPGFKASP